MEQKTFIEASYIYNIHTGEEVFLQPLLLKVSESFRFGQSKKTWEVLWSVESSLLLKRRDDQINIIYEKEI